MSSGYCSLEEELEDCFFTAKTTFFRNVQSKRPSKVNVMIQEAFTGRKQAPWPRRETRLLADRLSASYRSRWAVALRALFNLMTEQTPVGSFGDHWQTLVFFFNVLVSISCPRTFSKWLSRIWGPRLACGWVTCSPVPGRATFPQILALKLQVASGWFPVPQ